MGMFMPNRISAKVEAALLHGTMFLVGVLWFPVRVERVSYRLEIFAFYMPIVLIASALAYFFYNSHSCNLPPARYHLKNILRSIGILFLSFYLSVYILSFIQYLKVPASNGGMNMSDQLSYTGFFVFWFFLATWPALLAGNFLIFALFFFRYKKVNQLHAL
jgi:hypothetical protein